MKKGKELDGQLMPLFKTLFDAEDKLRQVVAERNQMLREKRLVAVEQAFGTENFGWQTLNVSLSARRAIDSVSTLAELKEVRRLAANNPGQHAMLTQLTKLEASYNSLIRIYNMTPER